MKNVCFGLLFAMVASFFSKAAQAQEQNISSIPIAVVMPQTVKNVPDEMLPLLQAKIEAIVTSGGLSADGPGGQSFVIYPVLSVFGKQQTAGTMQKITVVSGNLSLVIKQLATNTVFSSISKNIQGSGYSEEEASRDLFNQLNPSDQDFTSFAEKAKAKIISYYNQNCANLLKKAETERMQKKYESALSILLSVPMEASACYDRTEAQALAMYTEMIKYNCAKFVQEARNYAANNDYEKALQRLSLIDPTVSCGIEAKAIVNKIEKEVDDSVRKRWTLQFQYYKSMAEINKAEIKAYAMHNYHRFFINTQPSFVSYDSLPK